MKPRLQSGLLRLQLGETLIAYFFNTLAESESPIFLDARAPLEQFAGAVQVDVGALGQGDRHVDGIAGVLEALVTPREDVEVAQRRLLVSGVAVGEDQRYHTSSMMQASRKVSPS